MPPAGVAPRLRALRSFQWASATAALIMLAAVVLRVTAYGDPRASVGTMDTQSYMAHAGALDGPRSAFLGERLLTTGILYRLWGAHDCDLENISIPAIGREARPGLQDCFAGLASTQVALSVVGWSMLILSVIAILKHGFAKIAAASTLSMFAFAPQLADWDSILSSESLALSLLALSLGLAILGLKASSGTHGTAARGTALLACSIGAGMLWVLVRDPHAYTAIFMLALLLLWSIRAQPRRRIITVLCAAALAGCLLALVASRASSRWRIPLANAFSTYILPFDGRVEPMRRLGMPEAGTGPYDAWFVQNAPVAYAYFLATHPGFVLTTLAEHTSSFFADNSQPYFKTPDRHIREIAFEFGDLVHAKSTAVLTLDVVLVAGALISAARSGHSLGWPLAVMLAGLLASATFGITLVFFADAIGVERHVMLSVVLFRLVMWIGLAVMVDTALSTRREPVLTEPSR